MSIYQPSTAILNRYADVLVNFALNSGQGVKPNEIVYCSVPDVAKPLALALQNTILKSKAQPMIRLTPTGFDQDFYRLADQKQLTFFPQKYLKAKVDLINHRIGIIADPYPEELKNINPQKIATVIQANKPLRDWFVKKEVAGKHTWTIALWAVPAKAKLVNLSYKAYWQQIIKTCFLDKKNPIDHWRSLTGMQKKFLKKLNQLPIQSIKIEGKDVNLTVAIGADRLWQGGSGRNIPSFEIFTSPDWRGTEGWIKFNQPLYRYGNVIKGVYLKFNRGLVTQATALKGQSVLKALIKNQNADKVGEFSLTDKRFSRLTHVMAETLYDENIGGPYGNTHLAVGMAYKDCYRFNPKKLSDKDWQDKGFNNSAEHTDIISTTDRTVTATLTDGIKMVIYQKGCFTL